MKKIISKILIVIMVVAIPIMTQARPTNGQIIDFKIIAEQVNGFDVNLDDYDNFGDKIDAIGDIDNNGVTDFIVGVDQDDDVGSKAGAVYVILLNTDGTVKDYQKLSGSEGGLVELGVILEAEDRFGQTVEGLGDLDGDGVEDVLVGAERDDDAGANAGAVYIIFLNSDGTAKAYQKISGIEGGLEGESTGRLGSASANIGDLNNDGVIDVAVGARNDSIDGAGKGALYIFFLNSDGTVENYQRISDSTGGFGSLDNNDWFGGGAAVLSDMNGDDVQEIAVGAFGDDDGANNAGAIYILYMNIDGTVKSYNKYSATSGDIAGMTLWEESRWGSRLDSADIDEDGFLDLLTPRENYGLFDTVLFSSAGNIKESYYIYYDELAELGSDIELNDVFGGGIAYLGDVNGDNVDDYVVGARFYDNDGAAEGSVVILFMDDDPIGGISLKPYTPASPKGANEIEEENDVSVAEVDEEDVEESEEVEDTKEDSEISERRAAIIRLILQILIEKLQ